MKRPWFFVSDAPRDPFYFITQNAELLYHEKPAVVKSVEDGAVTITQDGNVTDLAQILK